MPDLTVKAIFDTKLIIRKESKTCLWISIPDIKIKKTGHS